MSTNFNVQFVASDTDGNVQMINVGGNDNSRPIFYEFETQEIELSDRAHVKNIQDKVVILSEKANSSQILIKQDDEDYETLVDNLSSQVSVSKAPSFNFHYLTFKWIGNSRYMSPVLEGFYLEKVIDNGILG